MATEFIACSNFKGDNKNKEKYKWGIMQILWHTDTAANGRNQQYKNQIFSGIEYFGLAQNKNSNDLFTFTLFLSLHGCLKGHLTTQP